MPDKEFRIVSLGKDSMLNDKAIESFEILGNQEKTVWNQQTDALVVAKPSRIPNKEAVGVRITFKQ